MCARVAFGLGVCFHMDVHGTRSGFLCAVLVSGKREGGRDDR